MNDKVKTLLDRVRDTAISVGGAADVTARQAKRVAEHMVDAAKLNMQIFDVKAEISALLRDVGQLVYKVHRGADAEESGVADLLAQIDEKNAAIDELKSRVAALRSARPCTVCGTFCGPSDRFCKQCGRRL